MSIFSLSRKIYTALQFMHCMNYYGVKYTEQDFIRVWNDAK